MSEQYCDKCDSRLEWVECWNCGGEGFSHHDCGDDCCCCLAPDDNVICDVCEGACGWFACPGCAPHAFND